MRDRADQWITARHFHFVWYTGRMPDEATTPNTLVAPGDEQTRTPQTSDASGDAHAAPNENAPAIPPTIPEQVHTRTDANRDARVRTSRKPPPENWLVIEQAIPRFSAAGLPIKLRTVQKYCLNGKLRCSLAVTDKNTVKYFVDPTSSEKVKRRRHRTTIASLLRSCAHRTRLYAHAGTMITASMTIRT